MCREFPFSPDEWCVLNKHANIMTDFIYNGKPLPSDLFQMIYNTFESYQFQYPKLVLLENSLEQKSSEENVVAANSQPKRKKRVNVALSSLSSSTVINKQNSKPSQNQSNSEEC